MLSYNLLEKYYENARVPNINTAAENITTFLSNFLPNLRISSFKCFGNSDVLTYDQRLAFQNNAIQFVDVAGGGNDASDYIIMTDMLSFAKHSPATSYFMLIGGDLDFYKVAHSLKKLGKKVLLAGPEGHTSQDLLKLVGIDHALTWEKLFKSELSEKPFKEEMLTWEQASVPLITGVFWNEASCPPPSYPIPEKAPKDIKDQVINGRYMTTLTCINEILESHALTAPSLYKAYSKHSIAKHLPSRVEYVYTTLSKRNKVENSMLVDVLQFAIDNHAPTSVVIFSDDDSMARAVKMGGYKVYVVVPEKGRDDLVRLSSAAGQNLIALDECI